jgi:hypothetical protein
MKWILDVIENTHPGNRLSPAIAGCTPHAPHKIAADSGGLEAIG